MTKDRAVTIELTAEMEAVLRRAVEAGGYASARDVMEEALRDWQERQELTSLDPDELGRLWDEGVASGPASIADFAEMKRTARRTHRQ